MGKLDGKVAIITGGARGMGAAYVRRFVAEGAQVLFSDILDEEGKALSGEVGERARFIKHNVANEDDWKAAISAAENLFGPVNILVNNAGVTLYRQLESMPLDEYMRVIYINQVSVFLGMKHVVPSMRAAGSGSIINISSIAGLKGSAYGAAYCSSKFAVRGLTQSAALELAPANIRVNSVHPGAIDTPMIAQDDNKAAVEQFVKTIPLRRVGTPEEVSNLVLYLASDDSRYVTAAEFVIDGGVSAL